MSRSRWPVTAARGHDPPPAAVWSWRAGLPAGDPAGGQRWYVLGRSRCPPLFCRGLSCPQRPALCCPGAASRTRDRVPQTEGRCQALVAQPSLCPRPASLQVRARSGAGGGGLCPGFLAAACPCGPVDTCACSWCRACWRRSLCLASIVGECEDLRACPVRAL